jgi:predicted pyridoxine 5'-phosphate oxidase superfamily flavin-nucleotide-binding protein
VSAIANLHQLRAIIGEPSAKVPLKLHDRLSDRAQAFIRGSPMLLLATADGRGQPTVSPKGDSAGFVRIADERTLLLPERKGNKLLFSLQNILVNPAVALILDRKSVV